MFIKINKNTWVRRSQISSVRLDGLTERVIVSMMNRDELNAHESMSTDDVLFLIENEYTLKEF